MGNCSDQSSINVATPHHQSQPLAPVCSAIPLSDGMEFDTIVIGGGLSGVSAAVELAKANQRVAVIEANAYLGGRLKSLPVNMQAGGVLHFDEGASWIHGSGNKNPISALSKYVRGLASKITEDDSAEVYDENGQAADDQADEGVKLYDEIMEKAESYDVKQSMQEVIEKEGEDYMNNKYLMYNISNDIEFQTSGPVRLLSAKGLDDDEYEGVEELILSGYQRFVDALAMQAKFDIFLNQKIKKISWREDHNEVTTNSGVTVVAKNVVISVPIGVLKANAIKFEPSLPQEKLQAISSIGFGNVCKILLDFPNIDFLESKSHYIGVVSEDTSKRGLGTYFLNLNAIAGVPALMTFGLGDNADEAEKMSEANLKAFLVKRINVFAKQPIGPNDFKIYRTSWRGNNNFNGTYAYASTQTLPIHWKNMASPVVEAGWYFCGEHTTSRYRGTVHGAYISGIKAAKSIISEVSQEDWEYSEISDESKKSEKSKNEEDE